MSDNNNRRRKSSKKKGKLNYKKSLKIFLLTMLILVIISGGVLASVVVSIIKDAPEIDPVEINASLEETSYIYDNEDNLLEKIDSAEYRTFVDLDEIPDHLINAFLAIEDERFFNHYGIDFRGILSSALENIKARQTVRGASTITQQLVKNVYLSPEKKWSRKITEAYLALQTEKVLHKNQILESYLNRNFFGQNAYGVQEAAQTYFSKDVGDLSLAESAVLAGVVKSTSRFQPYTRIKPEDYDSESHYQVGEADILGEKYILVFNEESVNRQKIVLDRMLDLEMISESQYEEALEEDIKESLNPGEKRMADITSYFADFVKSEVIDALVDKVGYSRDEAEELLFTGGLRIYSTMNLNMQKELEAIYDNFTEIVLQNATNPGSPLLINWRLSSGGNIIDDQGKIIYYRENNILNEDKDLIIENGSYQITDQGNLSINNSKLNVYPKNIDITDYYRVDDKNNLVTHSMGSLSVGEDEFSLGEDNELIISKSFLNEADNFYKIDDNDNLIISQDFFYRSEDGIVQPQSASIISDYRTGEIQALIGGRDVNIKGNRILNRATNARRQPGSVIKPISVYLPALDNGYTAATAIEDKPYDPSGWNPSNWYPGYRGIRSLRYSVEQSINTNTIRTLEDIGIATSVEYLNKMGISQLDDNDKNLAALALGGMTNGLTPLEITAAFGTIANDGVFVEPIAFTKVLDKDGNLLIDNKPKETVVVPPQIAYIMKDILHSTVNSGLGTSARIPGMAVAGKTGTTQKQADIWFTGFTPYYVSSLWIGNDSPQIRLNQNSTFAARFWQNTMTRLHDGLDRINSFSQPNGITSAQVCSESGLLATEYCSLAKDVSVVSEIFAQGTLPSKVCDIHTEEDIEDDEEDEDEDKDLEENGEDEDQDNDLEDEDDNGHDEDLDTPPDKDNGDNGNNNDEDEEDNEDNDED